MTAAIPTEDKQIYARRRVPLKKGWRTRRSGTYDFEPVLTGGFICKWRCFACGWRAINQESLI
ncbi:MAG: hypothetical protein CM1200mP12_17820 [Gammaproteobacteria bacterium]|nr:MAG: hypothetical protein CM1200mP12_17820 [Gammaproteobacteria bacterium]